jgi:hypothetical protein
MSVKENPEKINCCCCVGQDLIPKLTDEELKTPVKNTQVVTYITKDSKTFQECQQSYEAFYKRYIQPKFGDASYHLMNNAIKAVVSDMRHGRYPFLFGDEFARAVVKQVQHGERV